MPEREMLEMAARAAGWRVTGLAPAYMCPRGTDLALIIENDQGGESIWNPIVDDGDAFRLAVALHMRVKYHEALGQTLVWLSGSEREFQVNVEDCGRDPLAATRLAITRAAASIGEKMRDEAMGEEL